MTSPIPSEPRTPGRLYHAAAPIRLAISVTAFAIAAIYALQLAAGQLASPLVAFAVCYGATAIAIAIVAKARAFGLGITPGSLRIWGAAVLIGLSAWYVDLALVTWLAPRGGAPHLEAIVEHAPVGLALIAIALLPAIAEELVFRGVLARSLARRSVPIAILASALVFSLYHLLPIQMVATFPLGVALAILAVRSGSVLPGMLTHFLNNAMVIVLSHNALPQLARTIERYPIAAFAAAIASMGIGLVLANCKENNKPHLN